MGLTKMKSPHLRRKMRAELHLEPVPGTGNVVNAELFAVVKEANMIEAPGRWLAGLFLK